MNRTKHRESRLYLTLALLTVVLAGADIWYYASLPEAPKVVSFDDAAPAAALQTPQQPAAASETPLSCSYNEAIPAVTNLSAIIDPADYVAGNPEARVTVVEFFEPNCPHCRTFHPVMKQLIAAHGEKVRFVIKPVVFWDRSVLQGQALYAAQAAGKFEQMVEAQFANPKPNGLAEGDIRQIATAIGMDASVLMKDINDGAYRTTAYRVREAFKASGNNSVPAVLINGRTVEGHSRTFECLQQLIGEATRSTPVTQ